MNGDSTTILVIRLGAMGDILHALPAVATLKASFPRHNLVWLVARKWLPLLAGNPAISELIPFDRTGLHSLRHLRRTLHPLRPELAIDFQGLLQSAIAGRAARPKRFFGFDRSVAREPLASLLYSDPIRVTGPHRIERNMQLVQAAGAPRVSWETWLPAGNPEGDLPAGPYILASPFAGWNSKQWPIDLYDQLGAQLAKEGLHLVLNIPPERRGDLQNVLHSAVHSSSLPGLIYATRHAAAIVGVDSGPLHLAAALKKPGVALFGPTDPAQTGPFQSPMRILRYPEALTTYKRGRATDASMTAITTQQVVEALHQSLATCHQPLAAVRST